jgi:LysM domain
MPEMRVQPASRFAAVIMVVAACASPSAAPAESAARSGTGPTGPTPIPSFTRPTPLPAPTFLAYAVKSGDTLTSIARDFRTTPRSIAFWSRGEHPSLDPESSAYEPNRLEIGWVLLLIPDVVFDEDELPDATPAPPTTASPPASAVPAAS